MSLHALVGKWRDASEYWGQSLYGHQGIATTFSDCADELSAAIKANEVSGSGPVKWMNAAGDTVSAELQRSNPRTVEQLGYTTPLFTHPAGAVQVTDEMVTVALDAWHGASLSYRDVSPDRMRAALEAALKDAGR